MTATARYLRASAFEIFLIYLALRLSQLVTSTEMAQTRSPYTMAFRFRLQSGHATNLVRGAPLE